MSIKLIPPSLLLTRGMVPCITDLPGQRFSKVSLQYFAKLVDQNWTAWKTVWVQFSPLSMPFPSRKEGCVRCYFAASVHGFHNFWPGSQSAIVYRVPTLPVLSPAKGLWWIFLCAHWCVHSGTHAGSLVKRSSQVCGLLLVILTLPPLDSSTLSNIHYQPHP